MIRTTVLALFCLVFASSTLSAKEWAQKMFKITRHDFGHVAHGSKTDFAFEITNCYQEDVHIADVTTSCGCTTPTITKNTLKTWEKGAIVATFNTRSYSGQRNATIKVVIDKPFYAEVQLTVAGYIHNDVDFEPGSASFGDVDQGTASQKEITVSYYGRNPWQIKDVRSANDHLEVELGEPMKFADRVVYKMSVRLKDSAPAGYLHDTLSLVTDDKNLPSVPVSVEGRIIPPLTVSPSSLFVGVIEPGTTVTKQLVVRAKKPFKILSVKCTDEAFQFKTGSDSKMVHLVPVTFKAGDKPGEIEQTIEIETDLAIGGKTTCLARGTIQGETAEAAADVATKTKP
ncbi:MAG: DUF1573 domain-containing protein [Planctomycetales bacterium]|nr:DUF1573 domain-containing protein [Planctomycetales bacterium]